MINVEKKKTPAIISISSFPIQTNTNAREKPYPKKSLKNVTTPSKINYNNEFLIFDWINRYIIEILP